MSKATEVQIEIISNELNIERKVNEIISEIFQNCKYKTPYKIKVEIDKKDSSFFFSIYLLNIKKNKELLKKKVKCSKKGDSYNISSLIKEIHKVNNFLDSNINDLFGAIIKDWSKYELTVFGYVKNRISKKEYTFLDYLDSYIADYIMDIGSRIENGEKIRAKKEGIIHDIDAIYQLYYSFFYENYYLMFYGNKISIINQEDEAIQQFLYMPNQKKDPEKTAKNLIGLIIDNFL